MLLRSSSLAAFPIRVLLQTRNVPQQNYLAGSLIDIEGSERAYKLDYVFIQFLPKSFNKKINKVMEFPFVQRVTDTKS